MILPALHVLAAEYRVALATLADLDLEPQVIADTLESIQFPVEEKAANVVLFARNLEATADAIKADIVRQRDRERAIRARAEALREYVLRTMEALGMKRIECPQCTLATRKNPPGVEIFDERQIPAQFMRQPEPPAPTPDKRAILAAIDDGSEVPGARKVQSTRLEVK